MLGLLLNWKPALCCHYCLCHYMAASTYTENSAENKFMSALRRLLKCMLGNAGIHYVKVGEQREDIKLAGTDRYRYIMIVHIIQFRVF